MSTPHISAKMGDFAKTVLMPGDPKRAKHIAETYLKDYKLVTSVRNMYGYTGYYKGKKVSVMGSGMGIPSIGIYSAELYKFYGVEKIIRIGSCGSYQEDINVYDVIIAEGACTNSNFGAQFLPYGGSYSAIADFDLLNKAYNAAKRLGKKVHVGNILSSDTFYSANEHEMDQWKRLGVLAVEMESYGLYSTANYYGKKALCILTVSDSLIKHVETTSEERQKKLNDMVEIALELA